jgi:hypothetical protein
MMLPEMVEVEASYAAAMALYMTALLYEVQLPGHRSWADVLQIQNEDRFHRECLAWPAHAHTPSVFGFPPRV